jgi:hypothetical protein
MPIVNVNRLCRNQLMLEEVAGLLTFLSSDLRAVLLTCSAKNRQKPLRYTRNCMAQRKTRAHRAMGARFAAEI